MTVMLTRKLYSLMWIHSQVLSHYRHLITPSSSHTWVCVYTETFLSEGIKSMIINAASSRCKNSDLSLNCAEFPACVNDTTTDFNTNFTQWRKNTSCVRCWSLKFFFFSWSESNRLITMTKVRWTELLEQIFPPEMYLMQNSWMICQHTE